MKTCLIKPPAIRLTNINASAASAPWGAHLAGALVSAGPNIFIIDTPGHFLVDAARTTAE